MVYCRGPCATPSAPTARSRHSCTSAVALVRRLCERRGRARLQGGAGDRVGVGVVDVPCEDHGQARGRAHGFAGREIAQFRPGLARLRAALAPRIGTLSQSAGPGRAVRAGPHGMTHLEEGRGGRGGRLLRRRVAHRRAGAQRLLLACARTVYIPRREARPKGCSTTSFVGTPIGSNVI